MSATLQIVFGIGTRFKSKPVHCNLQAVTVGRDHSNTITVDDVQVSRHHALVHQITEDGYYLFDINSKNGTYVNGIRINRPTLLASGDMIGLGDSNLLFEQSTPPKKANDKSLLYLTTQTNLSQETIQVDRSRIKSISVLVADIRGYTALSERLSIKELSDLMSRWFDDVQQIVERNHGRVDKFIGDCVMAVWEIRAGQDVKIGVVESLKSAYEIYQYTCGLKEIYPDIHRDFRTGIGINTGEAAVGIGLDNTAIGDTVNLAFRLESASKDLNCDLVLSDTTYKSLPNRIWSNRVRSINVKGKANRVNVCTLNLATDKEVVR